MLPPDSHLHDRYRVIYAADERPGSTVYRARDEQSGRLVLLAELALGSAGGATIADLDDLRLLARQVAALRHEALLPTIDFFDESGAFYVVCEDVSGQDLERTLRARGAPLPEGPTLAQAQRVLGLLDHLHGQKPALFLGDPQPADLWIGDQGAWYVAPFALVRPIGAAPSPYRAPELDLPETEPTAASDLYGMSALLYQALTGWPPPTAAQREAGTPLNGPRALNPNLSTLAEQVLLRGLQLRPENRYQVARELQLSIDMVRMMDGRSLGSGPDVPPLSAQPSQVVPPQLPPVAPAPQAYPHGIYPTPPPPAIGPTQPLAAYPPAIGQPYAPAPERKRGVSTGCLIAVAVVLTLAAVAICAALAWFIPGSPLPSLLGRRGAVVAPSPASGGNPAPGAPQPTGSGAQPSGGLPAPGATSLGAGAISLANASTISETREITGEVLGPVAFSPDGRVLAVGISNAISLRDADTLEEFEPPRRIEAHADQVFTLAWSPDSRLLASGAINEAVVRLWDPSTGRLVRELKGHDDWIRAVTFSPDGKLLASGSYDRTVRVWDVASGDVRWTLSGHTDFIGTIAFAPDGKTLASSSADGSVRMWDVATGQPRAGFTYTAPPDQSSGQPQWATGLSFTPDGKTLAIGSADGSIAIVDGATGAVRRTLTGHNDIVVSRGVQFAPDGKTLATASFDGTVRLWDVASGRQTAEFADQHLRVLALAFSADGSRLASTSDQGGQLLVWDVRQQADPQSFRPGLGLVTALVFSPDSRVLGMVGFNGSMRVYSLEQGGSRVILGAAGANKSLAFAASGRLAAITGDGGVALVGAGDPQPKLLAGLAGRAINVVTSADGRLIVAASSTGAIGRWDGESGAAQPALHSEQLKAILALAVSDDGGLIAAGGPPDDPRIELWDAASGKLRQTLTGGDQAITALAFQPHGKLLAASDLAGQLRLWNVDDGRLVKTIDASQQQRWFSTLAFSPDGALLVTGSPSGQITFWNAVTGEPAVALPPGDVGVFSAAFSPDGERVAFGLTDQTVRIFEAAKGR